MHESGSGVKASLADSNMYLAEDRILCFEICAKKKEAWTLRYVKSAKASTGQYSTLFHELDLIAIWEQMCRTTPLPSSVNGEDGTTVLSSHRFTLRRTSSEYGRVVNLS